MLDLVIQFYPRPAFTTGIRFRDLSWTSLARHYIQPTADQRDGFGTVRANLRTSHVYTLFS